jgi:hypothetical protein
MYRHSNDRKILPELFKDVRAPLQKMKDILDKYLIEEDGSLASLAKKFQNRLLFQFGDDSKMDDLKKELQDNMWPLRDWIAKFQVNLSLDEKEDHKQGKGAGAASVLSFKTADFSQDEVAKIKAVLQGLSNSPALSSTAKGSKAKAKESDARLDAELKKAGVSSKSAEQVKDRICRTRMETSMKHGGRILIVDGTTGREFPVSSVFTKFRNQYAAANSVQLVPL